MKNTENKTLDIMQRWVKGELPTMEADKELAQLRTHDTVMIYKDPLTQRQPEGRAVLLHRVSAFDDGVELWKVCFEGDDGEVYRRLVKIN